MNRRAWAISPAQGVFRWRGPAADRGRLAGFTCFSPRQLPSIETLGSPGHPFDARICRSGRESSARVHDIPQLSIEGLRCRARLKRGVLAQRISSSSMAKIEQLHWSDTFSVPLHQASRAQISNDHIIELIAAPSQDPCHIFRGDPRSTRQHVGRGGQEPGVFSSSRSTGF